MASGRGLRWDANAVKMRAANRPPAREKPKLDLERQVCELSHQQTLFELANLHIGQHPELAMLNASANGGLRKRGVAGQLKSMGVKAGFPDIELPVARGGWFCLYIELKRLDGRPSADQLWWQERLTEQGNLALICRGWESAWHEIRRYLELAPTRVLAA